MEKEYIQVNKKAYNTFAIQHANRHKIIGKYELTDADWVKLLSEELLNKNLKWIYVKFLDTFFGKMYFDRI